MLRHAGLSWANDPGPWPRRARLPHGTNTGVHLGRSANVLYTPEGLPATDHTLLGGLGFVVHGDNTGLATTAWHDADDVPTLKRTGTTSGVGRVAREEVADIEALEAELDAGGLVNMYWIGRVNDATIRHDSEVTDLLSRMTCGSRPGVRSGPRGPCFDVTVARRRS